MAVSVNLSPHQFTDTTLVADVAGILAETILPASQLILEITESAIIGDIHASRTVLFELHTSSVNASPVSFAPGNSSP